MTSNCLFFLLGVVWYLYRILKGYLQDKDSNDISGKNSKENSGDISEDCCTVCYSNLNSVRLSCGHYIHLSCLSKCRWKDNNVRCPYCMQVILDDYLKDIFGVRADLFFKIRELRTLKDVST